MPTGTTIITNALIKLDIVEQGGSANAYDLASGLNELNNQWDAWGADEGLIFAVQPVTKALTANVGSYTLGPGGSFNIAKPTRVYKATLISTTQRNELKVVDADTYFSHNDLTASSTTPDECYVDFNIDPTTGFGTVKLYPVQTGTPTLELLVGAPFGIWALAVDYKLPPAYQDGIEWALAYRMIPFFGLIVKPPVAEVVTAMGQKAELRLRKMNMATRKLPQGPEMLEPPAPQQR